MSEETGEVRIIGADPERVVSVTVGDLETLLDDGMDVEAGFIGINNVTIHERTCHIVDACCSHCGAHELHGDARFCAYCGSRVVGE